MYRGPRCPINPIFLLMCLLSYISLKCTIFPIFPTYTRKFASIKHSCEAFGLSECTFQSTSIQMIDGAVVVCLPHLNSDKMIDDVLDEWQTYQANTLPEDLYIY